jgi:hypothetical protein
VAAAAAAAATTTAAVVATAIAVTVTATAGSATVQIADAGTTVLANRSGMESASSVLVSTAECSQQLKDMLYNSSTTVAQ